MLNTSYNVELLHNMPSPRLSNMKPLFPVTNCLVRAPLSSGLRRREYATLQSSREHIPPHQIWLTVPEARYVRPFRLPEGEIGVVNVGGQLACPQPLISSPVLVSFPLCAHCTSPTPSSTFLPGPLLTWYVIRPSFPERQVLTPSSRGSAHVVSLCEPARCPLV